MHIVCFQGGFANQLFQLCLYLRLREIYPNQRVCADISKYKKADMHGGFKVGKLTDIDILTKELNLEDYSIITEDNYGENIDASVSDYYYYGYWQDEKYFPLNMSCLYGIFDGIDISEHNKEYIDKMSAGESVSVHVRRGDYVNNYMHGNIANKTYYQNAIDDACDNLDEARFFVFSDDIDWCRENLKFNNREVIFVTGNENAVHLDLYLMSQCKHNIISNSSFSWWAQRINKNDNKTVYVPQYWFNENSSRLEVTAKNTKYIRNVPKYEKTCEKPYFSFLIPVYNKENTLKRCISTVLNQTYENIEIIVVDDGSTDNSYKVLEEYANNDARVTLIQHKENKSLLTSRITAMKQAKGEYVIFLDSDDYVEQNMCEILYSNLSGDSCDILEYRYIIKPSDKMCKDYPKPDDYLRASLMYEYSHTLWNKCYSKELIAKALNEMQEFYCNMSEDSYFTAIFYYYAQKIRQIEDVLHYYVELEGMTAGKGITLAALEKNCDSIDEKTARLKDFFGKHRQDVLDAVEYSKNKQIEFMRTLSCSKDVSIKNQLILLEYLDGRYGTEYASDMDNKIKELLRDKARYSESGRKKKLVSLAKAAIKDVILNR